MMHQIRPYSIENVYNEILSKVSNIDSIKRSDSSMKILLSEFEKENIIETLKYMLKSKDTKMVKDANDIFKKIITTRNRGDLYELLVYSYFRECGIPFKTHVEYSDIGEFKNSQKYICDGSFSFGFDDNFEDEQSSVLFEVKTLGMGESIIIKLREQLEKLMKNYLIMIDGDLDVSTQKVKSIAMENLFDICEKLKESKQNFIDGALKYHIPDLNINIKAIPYSEFEKSRLIVSGVSSFNPYKWAKDNELYFIHHCSQVCTSRPYILIYPFDECINHSFTGNMCDITNTGFRSLSRRIFMGLRKCDEEVQKYDGKAKPDLKVSEVVKYI